jgi:hypothetical protein
MEKASGIRSLVCSAVLLGLSVTCMEAQAQATEVPVYRFSYLLSGNWHHFYTLDYQEGVSNGMNYEGIGWQVLTNAPNDAWSLLYRCDAFEYGTDDHFASLDSNCEGYRYEGIFGYIYTGNAANYGWGGKISQLYRFYRAGDNTAGDHLITENYNEGPANGYAFEFQLGLAPVP